MQTIIGIEDAFIDVVIGRVTFPRIMSFCLLYTSPSPRAS